MKIKITRVNIYNQSMGFDVIQFNIILNIINIKLYILK
jgi:hypothetical protein